MTRKETDSHTGEIFTLHVTITGSESVEGTSGKVTMLSFHGSTDTVWFRGETVPHSVDTQIQKNGENVSLSARYILQGVDGDGQNCRVFIENNGWADKNGTMTTTPTVFTDSTSLKWLEQADLYGEATNDGGQLTIHIFSTGEEKPLFPLPGREHGKKQAVNPYLPSWEYIPDGEPYVFDGRVYVYGSHDQYGGEVFCLGDYVCWSAPVDDLGNWRYEGVIYPKTEDPLNRDGAMCLYAPDVTVGPDGRFYLYYVLDHVSVVSVAVCDTPAGRYQFYGYVHYEDGTRLGEREGDEPQFDPGVLTEGDSTYLYTGFCGKGDKSRTGAMATVLADDMLTIRKAPVIVAPGCEYAEGTGFEGHAFFEAPSIRKIGDTYYFIYSSTPMHELCYATSKTPCGKFTYGGVMISNCDLHIDRDKPADLPMAYGANNHGSIVEINGTWYIFYHRHTNGSWYSRQGCAEEITLLPDGSIPQAELTSCGLNGGPLEGRGRYPAYLACHLFTDHPSVYVGGDEFPKIVQDGRDGDREPGYITNMKNSATAGFKYFDCRDIRGIRIWTRGYADGVFEVRTNWSGTVLATIPIHYTNVWEKYDAAFPVPDGKQALYLTYRGGGTVSLLSFELF